MRLLTTYPALLVTVPALIALTALASVRWLLEVIVNLVFTWSVCPMCCRQCAARCRMTRVPATSAAAAARSARDGGSGGPSDGALLRTSEDRFAAGKLPGYEGPGLEPHYVTTTSGIRIAYVDAAPTDRAAGTAPAFTALCLHGMPTWGYLYRKMLPVLRAAGGRVVVPDAVGFGRSDKLPDRASYTHDLHQGALLTLAVELDLRDVVLVVQDWGGLVGLSSLPMLRGRVARLVVMNTALPPQPLPPVPVAVNFCLWRAFCRVLGTDLPVGAVMRGATRSLSNSEAAAYDAPFPSAAYRCGAAAWPPMVPLALPGLAGALLRLLVDQSTMPFAAMAAGRAALAQWRRPTLVAFSDGCPVTAGLDRWFLDTVPALAGVRDAVARGEAASKEVVTAGLGRWLTIRGAGHFLQEDKGAEVATAIVRFIREVPAA